MVEKSEVDEVEMWWRLEEALHLVLKALAGLQIVVAMKAAATRAACLRDDDIISLAVVVVRYNNYFDQTFILLWVQGAGGCKEQLEWLIIVLRG